MFYLGRNVQKQSSNYKSNKIYFFALFCAIGLTTGLSVLTNSAFANETPQFKTIAITQIVRHESLDKVTKGILDELSANGYQDRKTARIKVESAQGNVILASQIAQQFMGENPDVIVAIATTSAQAVANAAKKTKIPIVFASISDPVTAKLVSDLKQLLHL